MRKWLYWHFPVITTRYRQREMIAEQVKNQVKCAIHIVNTRDKERVDRAIEWLERNFEVKND